MTSDTPVHAVAKTARQVAAFRAIESERPESDRRLNDPYARLLAGDEGFELQQGFDAAIVDAMSDLGAPMGTAADRNFIAARAAWFDQQFEAAFAQNSEIRQVVVLGSGMDTRAFRFDLPGVTTFELDYAPVHAYKEEVLRGVAAKCKRVTVATDLLAEDWAAALVSAGFDAAVPTLWIAEGLFYYLPTAELPKIRDPLDRLAAPGSRIFFDGVDDQQALAKSVPKMEKYFHDRDIYFYNSTPETTGPLGEMGWREVVSNKGHFMSSYVWSK